MKVLIGYSWGPGPVDGRTEYEGWISRLRIAGYEVDGFCLTLNPPAWTLTWTELNWLWRTADKSLMTLYERLASACERYDIFLNYSGINVHPEFVCQLPTFNVFSCFDDPESSEELSKPAASAYDLALVGNAAEVETYRSWGVKDPHWWPLGFRATDFDPRLQADDILKSDRDIDLTLLCERKTAYRRSRLDRVVRAFPQGRFHGHGWPAGFLPERERVPLLQRTKIGMNLHNTTGPINFRTYYLPANGVLQLCDNKSHLGRIYEVGREVVGFDSIDEGIDLCRYYLAHDQERREIAGRGWERATRDYNEVSCFGRLFSEVQDAIKSPQAPANGPQAMEYLRHHSEKAHIGGLRRWSSKMWLHLALLARKIRRRVQSYYLALAR